MKKFTLTKKTNLIIGLALLIVALVITLFVGKTYYDFSNYETEFVVREGIEIEKFSKYSPNIKGIVGDSNIYIIRGAEPGPSILILGGTHANEPSGQLTATVFLENINVQKGTVYVVTETNRSAYTHTHPQEGTPMYYVIETANGVRTFKFGSRATNTNQQWPIPDIYVTQSGQILSGSETRNINRSYPGTPDGTYTERVAYAVTELIRQNNITITIDLHEASPEYMTINAIVAHQRALDIASAAYLKMAFAGVDIAVEESPVNFHGLTHRELGDYTDTLAFLCETSNASQGKLRGAFTSDLITTGKDKFYQFAVEYDKTHPNNRILYAPPVDISERVARHVLSVVSIMESFNESVNAVETGAFEFSNVPSYDDIIANGVGNYLLDSRR